MTDAIEAWYEELKKPEADQISMTFFAEQRGIPLSTVHGHVTPSDSKRIKLGASVGRKPIISLGKDVREAVREAVNLLETMQPEFKRTQLEGSFRRTVRPKFVKALTGSVTVQATTTKRTAFTAAAALVQGKASQASVHR